MGATTKQRSTLGVKEIPSREISFRTADMWLEDKRTLDGAEGLWRVYDGLYDLSDFVEKHPGGKFWIEATEGTDITEGFESHHISTVPLEMLKKYFVRKAKSPRSSPFTFKEDGFYKTLKRNVREALKTIPKGDDTRTNLMTDTLLAAVFATAILACTFWSYTLGAISGLLLACMVVASHNYYHRKDNFRMYYTDIGMLQSREARIIHILSHHLYTNTVADMQAYLSEPMVNFFPIPKSLLLKYGSWIYIPFIIWPTLFYVLIITRLYRWMFGGNTNSFSKADLFEAALPVTMCVFGGQPFFATIGMFLYISALHGFFTGVIGLTTTHFHPEILIDGDKPRPEDERDWGISQLDTVSDRHDITGKPFLVLVTFGDHALHHLFPTFDHGVLHHLYPVVTDTMKQFNVDIRMTSHFDMFVGFFKQLARDKPNINLPNLIKRKE